MLFTRKKTTQLTPTEAKTRAEAGEIVLVDVRERDERSAARPSESLHIPLGELPARLGELPQPVAFICRSGSRSEMATRAASERGLTAGSVRGGMLAWAEAGLPVETGPEPDTTTATESR